MIGEHSRESGSGLLTLHPKLDFCTIKEGSGVGARPEQPPALNC